MLDALGIPLVQGRDLQIGDRADGGKVVLLNETAARTIWPTESAVGKRLQPLFAPADWGVATVVGVYADVRGGGLTQEPAPQITLPLSQMPGWIGFIRTGSLVVYASAGTESIVTAARAAVHEIDPNVPVEFPTTLVDVVRASTARERFVAALLQTFAALALVIAGVGVFGVVSFTVARQSRELAIRNALGADRRELLLRVLKSTAAMAGIGVGAGTIIVLIASPGLAGFLHGVAPRDTLVLVSVPLALLATALLSSLSPALRASRVSPAAVLQDGE
jgi:predicted lysophospholipase L1 biosynthesis ABC-type transport system permease subunit